MSYLIYEIKKKKHIFAVSLIVILSILISFLIRIKFPDVIISLVTRINETNWLKVLVALDANIDKLTVQDILVGVFKIFEPAMLCLVFLSATYVVVKDERMGVSLFYSIHTIKKEKTLLIKILIDLALWSAFFYIICALMIRLSIMGVEDIEFFRVVIKEDIYRIMKRFISVAFLMWSTGFLYGVINKTRVETLKVVFLFAVISVLMLIPAQFKSLAVVYDLNSRASGMLNKLSDFLIKVFKCVPNFWCTEEGNVIPTKQVCVFSIVLGILLIMLGIILNGRNKK